MITTIYSDYSPMEWNPKHSVEVPELDRQHKELSGFFNETLNHCSGEAAEERTYFDKTINGFIFLLEKHFEAEEQYFSRSNYPFYKEHILDHIKLLEKINFIKTEIENNRWGMKLHILAITLKSMLMYHFNAYDTNIKGLFGESGVAETEITVKSNFAFQGL